jgi:prophage regulatory protein
MLKLPETGYLRLKQIIGEKSDVKKGRESIPAIIPVSKSNWWQGVKTGKYPQPIKIGARCTAWRVEDIRNLVEALGETR